MVTTTRFHGTLISGYRVSQYKFVDAIYLGFGFVLQGSRLLESNFINNTLMIFGLCLRVCRLNSVISVPGQLAVLLMIINFIAYLLFSCFAFLELYILFCVCFSLPSLISMIVIIFILLFVFRHCWSIKRIQGIHWRSTFKILW